MLLAGSSGVLRGASAGAASAGDPKAGDVRVRLAPEASTSAAQGTPFAFRATIWNPGSSVVDADVTFSLAPAGSGHGVDFTSWAGSLAAGERVPLDEVAVSATWFAGTGTFAVRASLLGQPTPAARLDYQVLPPTRTPPRFEDVTAASGIDAPIPKFTACMWAAGAAWGDIEGDGDLDLFVPSPDGPSTLWVNDGTGHFTEQAAARGVAGDGTPSIGAVFVDYNRDGHEDLYVTNGGPNFLYRNDGTGHFTDVAVAAGVADGHQSFSASWGDYDGDGYPDLYVTDYQQCFGRGGPRRPGRGGGRLPNTADHLYHNDGDGTFTDVTDQLPPAASTEGAGFEASWFDYNGDGRPDLYLANDSLTEILPSRNHLWRNDGPGVGGAWRFTDVSMSSGTNFDMHSMGIAVGDYDRDLRLDFAVSNIAGNVLARNNGDGTFTDMGRPAQVARPFQDAEHNSITWGLAFADLNLDGWEDLYVNAGALTVNQPQPNEVFVNAGDGTGTFLDLSALSGANDSGASKGLSLADFDRDGRMDLVVVDQAGRVRLFRNVTPRLGRHWLELKLLGTASNPDACGARVMATTTEGSMLREVFCGSVGLSGGSDPTLHFGLDAASQVDQLTIDWPSGQRQVFTGVAVDRVLDVVEPASARVRS